MELPMGHSYSYRAGVTGPVGISSKLTRSMSHLTLQTDAEFNAELPCLRVHDAKLLAIPFVNSLGPWRIAVLILGIINSILFGSMCRVGWERLEVNDQDTHFSLQRQGAASAVAWACGVALFWIVWLHFVSKDLAILVVTRMEFWLIVVGVGMGSVAQSYNMYLICCQAGLCSGIWYAQFAVSFLTNCFVGAAIGIVDAILLARRQKLAIYVTIACIYMCLYSINRFELNTVSSWHPDGVCWWVTCVRPKSLYEQSLFQTLLYLCKSVLA